MTPEIIAILVLILVGSLIFVEPMTPGIIAILILILVGLLIFVEPMTPGIIAILALILVGSLIFVIDIRLWLRRRQYWRWLEVPRLKEWAVGLVNLLIMPIVLTGGVIWFVQSEGSIWAILGLALAGLLVLKHLLFWERYVRLRTPKVAEVEAGTTIWDVAKVVLVPAVLSLGLLWLNVAQANRQDRIEQTRIAERAEATKAQGGTNAAATGTSQTVQAVTATAGQATQAAATGTSQAIQSTVEANRVNANILQSYFDDMTTFVLAESTTITQTEVQSLIRARTLTVLSDLDGKRNGTVLRFLQELQKETELIDLVKDDLEGINLGGADLRRTKLSGATLRLATLRFADLRFADLRFADLRFANLRFADLSEADLSGAKLRGAILSGAVIDNGTQIDDKWRLVWEIVTQGATRRDLSEADLSGAYLMEAYLIEADLSGANLSEAYLNEADLGEADLSDADLSGANLSGANLSGAKIDDTTQLDDKWRLVWEIVNQGAQGLDLSGADLSFSNLVGVDLRGADLYGADLRWANLSGANLSGANYNTAPFQDELGNTYQPTQWPDDFDPVAAGAVDVSETP
jgi:uncharacterized protein YjbI with pentapeptide repeats